MRTTRIGRSASLAALAVGVLLSPLLASCTLPQFVDEAVLSGLKQPTSVAFSPDGRIFVAEKRGVVKVFDGLGDPTASVLLDLRTQVYNQHDRGLISIALPPDFPARPYLYALYSLDAGPGQQPPRWGTPGVDGDPCPNPPGDTIDGCVSSGRLSRFDLSGPTPGPEQVLIQDWCDQFPSHSVGDLVFGPDGQLYASGGEGASYSFADYGQAGTPKNPCDDPPTGTGGTQTVPTAEGGALRAQDYRTPGDPQTLDGTIIRIDPDTGAGATGNPGAGSDDPNLRRVIAQGVRNPFRMVFRPGTGELWFGDVGWGLWEEVNVLADPTSGTIANYGWPCREGPGRNGYNIGLALCAGIFDGSVPVQEPVFAYKHGQPVVENDVCTKTTTGSAISGLVFYPGGSYPRGYNGSLFFADYGRRCIWAMLPGADGRPDPSTVRFFAGNDVFPVDLQIGPGNDVFYLDIAGGQLHRIRYASGVNLPTAAVSATPTGGPLPLTVTLSAAGSSTAGGGTLAYAWDLDGDGVYDDAKGVTITHTYTTAGEYTPSVRVVNDENRVAIASTTVLAGTTRPVPTIDTPDPPTPWAVGDPITFSGHATDAEEGSLPPIDLSWEVVVHHCATVDGCHAHQLTSFEGVASGSFAAPDHEYPSYLEVRLTATDSTGVSATTSKRLDPKVATVSIDTDPSGVPVTIGDDEVTAPLSMTVIEGTHLSLSVPATVTIGSTAYEFEGWSDGLARSHDVIAGAGTTARTATFRPLDPGPTTTTTTEVTTTTEPTTTTTEPTTTTTIDITTEGAPAPVPPERAAVLTPPVGIAGLDGRTAQGRRTTRRRPRSRPTRR